MTDLDAKSDRYIRLFSQVLGLNVVLKLRLLSQLSFALNPYSQKGT